MLTAESCISCNWINSSDVISTEIPSIQKPSLAVAFLHTRKSGGTNFHAIVAQWLSEINCIPKSFATPGKLERGIIDGKLIYHIENSTVACPNINFRSIESECWDPIKMSLLPAKGLRNNAPLSLFTIFRDPIDRIGSQAFYSQGVVGTQTIMKFIIKDCIEYIKKTMNNGQTDFQNAFDGYEECKVKESLKSIPNEMKDTCNCMFSSYTMAIQELKTNEQLWYDWFNYSNRQSGWHHNFYKKNYYLERIVGGRNSLDNTFYNKTFHYALDCLNNHGCKENTIVDYKLNVLEQLSSMYHCYRNEFPSPITRESLQVAKLLLQTHIDFIIMENYTERTTAGAIASLLNANKDDIVRLTKMQYYGASKLSSTRSYRNLMPPSIIKYLEIENELDLEFYRFAVLVFKERAENGYWND